MYFDPGTGSIIIQVLLALLASLSAFFVAFRTKILTFFQNKRKKRKENEKK